MFLSFMKYYVKFFFDFFHLLKTEKKKITFEPIWILFFFQLRNIGKIGDSFFS